MQPSQHQTTPQPLDVAGRLQGLAVKVVPNWTAMTSTTRPILVILPRACELSQPLVACN